MSPCFESNLILQTGHSKKWTFSNEMRLDWSPVRSSETGCPEESSNVFSSTDASLKWKRQFLFYSGIFILSFGTMHETKHVR